MDLPDDHLSFPTSFPDGMGGDPVNLPAWDPMMPVDSVINPGIAMDTLDALAPAPTGLMNPPPDLPVVNEISGNNQVVVKMK